MIWVLSLAIAVAFAVHFVMKNGPDLCASNERVNRGPRLNFHIFFFLSVTIDELQRADVARITTSGACNVVALDPMTQQVLRSVRVMPSKQQPRILCVINTDSANKERQASIKATWIKRCNEVFFASNVTDPSLPAVRIEHPGEESHGNLWRKTRALGVTLKNWPTIDRYDWVLRADDDAFVIMENLRHYLRSPEISRFQPRYHRLLLGHVFDLGAKHQWHIAGSAFVMSHAMIQAFGELVEKGEKCWPDMESSADDWFIAQCMQDEFGDIPIDTKDDHRRDRFHILHAGGVAAIHTWKVEDWYNQMHGSLKSGLDCCSDRSISFHYVDPKAMLEYEKVLYKCRN